MRRSIVCTIIKKTCEVIQEHWPRTVKAPCSVSEWEKIRREFDQRWNFPNCVGMYLACRIGTFHNIKIGF